VSADVGNAPKARLGQVNARRRGPLVVCFLGETIQGLSLLYCKFYNTKGARSIYYPSDDKNTPKGRGLLAGMIK